MKKIGRLLRRLGAIIGTAAFALIQYRKISKKYSDDKDKFVEASLNLSNQAMTRLKNAADVEVVFNGAARYDGPAIYVANHMSFLDAPVIGSVLNTSFVSKEETEKQLFVGPMLRALSTTFIKRTSDDLPRVREILARKLNDGRNIMFFPEATTTDGSFVLPFRGGILQALFSKNAPIKDGKIQQIDLPEDLRVQAFTMRLTHINGVNVEENREETQHLRDIFTNHLESPGGVINEALHTFKYMSSVKTARVEVTAHEPLNPFEFEDGNAVVNASRSQIAPIIQASVDPNISLWERYKGGNKGWKAPKVEFMEAMRPVPHSQKANPQDDAPTSQPSAAEQKQRTIGTP